MSWPWTRKPQRQRPEQWIPDAWPCDAATLERWLRETLLEPADDSEVKLGGLDRIRVSAEVTGPEISHLLIDATGVAITVDPGDQPRSTTTPTTPATPEIVTRNPGVLRSARLAATPVVIQGFDVHVEGSIQDLALDWVRYATEQEPDRPASIFGFEEPEDKPRERPSGTFSARMRASDIAPMLKAVIQPLLATAGVRLRRLDATVTASSRQKITVDAVASVRWKIVGATVRATAVAHVDPDGVITVKRLRLRSRNPLIAAALAVARSSLREAEGKRVDLNEGLSTGTTTLRIHDLRITADEDVAVSARFS